MNIAFIGFGKVAYNLSKLIQSFNINLISSDENRSQKTIELLKKANVEIYPSFAQAVSNADIVISSNSPKNALTVAKKYSKKCKGIYLDLNNISPKTTLEINSIVDNFVDGAIIGKIDSDNPTIFLSGEKSEELMFLNEFLNVKIISSKIGDASKLKMIRSSYTKALSVLLIESFELAKNHGLTEEFFDVLTLTEGEDFKQKSISRINNTLDASKRKNEEILEILDYFGGDDLKILEAALSKLKQY